MKREKVTRLIKIALRWNDKNYAYTLFTLINPFAGML